MIGGDLNVAIRQSPTLAAHMSYGIWKISDESPTTTMRGVGDVSKNFAIDHLLCNSHMLECGVRASVSYEWRLADHFPIVGWWRVPKWDISIWRWPAPSPLGAQVAKPESESEPVTYTEWRHLACQWISRAFAVEVQDKTQVAVSQYAPKTNTQDAQYLRLCAAMQAVQEAQAFPTPQKLESLGRKIVQLGVEPLESLSELQDTVQSMITRHLTYLQDMALAQWRVRVSEWKTSSAALYRFIKNPLPSKACILTWQGVTCATGEEIHAAMSEFWGGVESWPSESRKQHAHEVIHVHLRLLPCRPTVIGLNHEHLFKQAKIANKRRCPGPDGWSALELSKLPKRAWLSLSRIFERDLATPMRTLLRTFRRVPLEKGERDEPGPGDYRPVDVFSSLIRIYSSAQMAQIKAWLNTVLHEKQFGMKGGTIMVAAKTAIAVERAVQMKKETWGFSLDFSKLFNMLSPSLACLSAQALGLTEEDARRMVEPIQQARGYWRLPRQECSPPFSNERGLPQGLAGSVAMAEILLSLLIYKLASISGIDVFAYIDDIHLTASCIGTFKRGLDVVRQYAWDFALELATSKSCVWGTNAEGLAEITRQYGFERADAITTMGAYWHLAKHGGPQYQKELQRLGEARSRLERMQHFSAKPHIKTGAAATVCLPLVNYLPTPNISEYKALRASIRRATDQVHGAWEVGVWCFSNGATDPEVGWIISLMHLWHTCAGLPHGHETLAALKKGSRNSRLSSLLKWCSQAGWSLEPHSLAAEDMLIPMAATWSVCRSSIVNVLRARAFRLLEKRRPLVFGGIQEHGIDTKMMKKMSRELAPYQSATLQRIWMGAAMTRDHASRMNAHIPPSRECGAPRQTIEHLLRHCPNVESTTLEQRIWMDKHPAAAVALLCPLVTNADEKMAWKSVCHRATRIVSRVSLPPAPPRLKGTLSRAGATGSICLLC